jgi:hypothetical protein
MGDGDRLLRKKGGGEVILGGGERMQLGGERKGLPEHAAVKPVGDSDMER